MPVNDIQHFKFERTLSLDHPSLALESDTAFARQLLVAYEPADMGQRQVRDRMLRFIDAHPEDAHRRTCLEGHLTASALVVERHAGRVLLTHHRKLGRWLQLGGHADGDANLPAVALREAWEESGIEGLRIAPEIVDVDIHPIPARPGEPTHLHLDTRFLVWSEKARTPQINHESNDLQWLTLDKARGLDLDESVERLLRLLE